MLEMPPETSWLCTASVLVPGSGFTVKDQLETAKPPVNAAAPLKTELVAELVNQYRTVSSRTLLGSTPGNTGELWAVPEKTGAAVRALAGGDDMETAGACRARKFAVKIRFDRMINGRVGAELVTPPAVQWLKTEALGLAVMK
jgi:hypothetical protein